jgi:hypothetical protein
MTYIASRPQVSIPTCKRLCETNQKPHLSRWYVSVSTARMQAGFGKVQVVAALHECIFMFLIPSLNYQISASTEQPR